MKSVVLAFAALGIAACKPPPAVKLADTGSSFPSIEIVHPVSGTMALDDNCELPITVAVDIDNFDVVKPNIPGQTDEDVNGQGHWHLSFAEGSYEVVDENVASSLLMGLSVDDLVVVTGTLQTNTHEDVDSPGFEDRVEITITNNGAASCP
jgi:hypothetical protein